MSWLERGSRARVIATGEEGTRLPLLGDAHVHLGLTDPTLLLAGGIGRVQELGWIPEVARGWRTASLASAAASAGTAAGTTGGTADTAARVGTGAEAMNDLPEISIAGAFLAAVGGYPAGREWAPAGAVREVTSPADARGAVAEQAGVGASVIKVTLNSEAGPVFDDVTMVAIIGAAQDARLRVVAHVEGAGQCARAIAAHVEVLAHTPFS